MHVVRHPNLPLTLRNGLRVHQIPVWKDNFTWLVEEAGQAFAVDGPAADPVVNYCRDADLTLCGILNTHTHPDHIGINKDLARNGQLSGLRVIGSEKVAGDIPGITEAVKDGDRVMLVTEKLTVWLTEGHLDGHISFLTANALFPGDTLFGAGCGYVFDGPASKLYASLQRFATLPPETLVFPAHEYTVDNLRFTLHVDSDNETAKSRQAWATEQIRKGQSTLPFTIDDELATNPFMRLDTPSIITKLAQLSTDAEQRTLEQRFKLLREYKNQRRY